MTAMVPAAIPPPKMPPMAASPDKDTSGAQAGNRAKGADGCDASGCACDRHFHRSGAQSAVRGMTVLYRLVTGLQNVWICAQDLQLIRADRVVSLLVGSGYGAASPGDLNLHRAIFAEIDGGTESDTISQVKLETQLPRKPFAPFSRAMSAKALASRPSMPAGC